MRPEDIIADFLSKLDLSSRQPQDAARDLISQLERHQLFVTEESEPDFDWIGE